ncbi:MAG: preprotein translocase subunit YajC [Ruminococcus sp.]|nr:preprotein translocase subunit YajC [Ruminococcus sp.]
MKKKLTGFFTAVSAVVYSGTLTAISAFAEDGDGAVTTAATGQQVETGSVFWTLVFPLVIMFVLLYFVAIRPQKKRENELKTMQETLQVGDEIVTGGGIVGIVVSTGEDTVVIETGGARHKLRIKTWAITENVTAQERMKDAKNKTSAPAKKAENGLASAGIVEDDDEKPKTAKKLKKTKKSEDEEE